MQSQQIWTRHFSYLFNGHRLINWNWQSCQNHLQLLADLFIFFHAFLITIIIYIDFSTTQYFILLDRFIFFNYYYCHYYVISSRLCLKGERGVTCCAFVLFMRAADGRQKVGTGRKMKCVVSTSSRHRPHEVEMRETTAGRMLLIAWPRPLKFLTKNKRNFGGKKK